MLPECQYYLEAFSILSNSRALHLGAFGGGMVGFIQPSEITNLHAKLYAHVGLAEFISIIQHMDGIYVQHRNEKLTSDAPKK